MSGPRGRLAREAEFHDSLFARGGREWLGGVNRLQAPARDLLDRRLRGGPEPGVVVEVGVGRVSRLADPEVRRGALGVALDISQVGLRRAASAAGSDVAFVRADAQRLPLRSGAVDLIVGTSIVHHLDVATTAGEMARALRADGRVLLLEPRVGSPLLRVFRRFTPGLRSADEHPLSPRDIATLRERFASSQVDDFALTSLVAAPLLRRGVGGALAAALGRLDRLVLRLVPALSRWAWIAVIELARPRAGSGREPLE